MNKSKCCNAEVIEGMDQELSILNNVCIKCKQWCALQPEAKEERTNVHFLSQTNEWATPQRMFDELNEEFQFSLDPCATQDNAKCSKYFTKEVDGLSQSWDGEKVFMNPPYGREIGKWVQKMATSKLSLGVALLPARTDTKWFHDYILGKAEIRFVKGRLKFGNAKDNAPFPSMIVIWNNKPSDEGKYEEKKIIYFCEKCEVEVPKNEIKLIHSENGENDYGHLPCDGIITETCPCSTPEEGCNDCTPQKSDDSSQEVNLSNSIELEELLDDWFRTDQHGMLKSTHLDYLRRFSKFLIGRERKRCAEIVEEKLPDYGESYFLKKEIKNLIYDIELDEKEQCNHDDCLRDGVRENCWSYNEAKQKIINNNNK